MMRTKKIGRNAHFEDRRASPASELPGQMLARWPMVRGQQSVMESNDQRERVRWNEGRRLKNERQQKVSTVPLLIGRVFFGGFFLYNGINHFRNRRMMTEYTRSANVPAPDLAVIGSGALITAGGLSILSGAKPKLGASMIAAFLLGVTPVMHAFWKKANQEERMQQIIHFSKNAALLGGASLAASIPEPWPVSIRA